MITDTPTEKTEKTGKVEKVRGMNASLETTNESGQGPLGERDPGRLHITRRQLVFTLVLAVLAALAAILTVQSVTAGAQSYPAVVATANSYDLNFTNTAEVKAVLVKVGQHVTAGQVLATQDAGSLVSELTDDQAVVTADQEAVNQSGQPSLTPAQQEQDSLAVSQAQTAVTNAQAGLNSATATSKANVAAAQTAYANAQTLYNSDLAQYTQACPNGPVPPASPGDTSAQAAYTHCQTLQQKVAEDQTTVASTQAQIPVVEAQGQQAIDTAQSTLNSAESALNAASSQGAVQSSPESVATQAQAEASLNQAKSQLAEVQQSMKDSSIVSPDNGVVSSVYAEAGEVIGPNGVHLPSNPAALPSTGSSGFQLFPTQPAAQGGGTTSNGNEPAIEVIGGRQQVLAQVPEASVPSLPVGHSVTITFNALNRTASGTVTETALSPTRNNTAVTYNVYITLDRPVPGLLPGMSASVRS